jgi:hypothetical protein
MGRNVFEKIGCKIPVRIDDTHTSASFNVLEDEIPKEGGLSDSAFSHGVEVLTSIGERKNKGRLSPPLLVYPNDYLVAHTQTSPYSAEKFWTRFLCALRSESLATFGC